MLSLASQEPSPAAGRPGAFDSATVLSGVLHIFVAFDWGDEIHLDQARRLVPAEVHALARRRRTPTSIGYRPPPLRVFIPPLALELPEIGGVSAPAEATVFDFGAVSLGLHVPFRLPAECLTRLAGWLADPTKLVQAARSAMQPLYRQLLPAIDDPLWTEDLSEEYFVFQPVPGGPLAPTTRLLQQGAPWLASLARLEAGALSPEEVDEALRLHISYSPEDLIVVDWAAAVLIDRDCEETLQTIEFVNLQLLEFRHIDNRLDDSLAGAYRVISTVTRSGLPFWRSHGRSLRILGTLKVEANGLFERTENVLKLVGDQYLARVYRLLATRFHLEEWEQNIQRKLEVDEGVYQILSDQAATYRTEALEVIVILLILVELLLALFRH